jgi:hypothetical protein
MRTPPKARDGDIVRDRKPSVRRPTRRLWREDPYEQHLLAWMPADRYRLGWMRMPEFAKSSEEPDA